MDDISWKNYLADRIWNCLPASSLKTRSASQFNFRCPICGDSKKSATKKRGYYYVNTASYHCFNCETTLSGMGLLKRIAPESIFYEASRESDRIKIESLSSSGHQEIPIDSTELVVCEPRPAWKILIDDHEWPKPTALTPEASQYLDSRKIKRRNDLLSINSPSGIPFILIQYKYLNECIFYQLHNYTGATMTNGVKIKYMFPNSLDLNDQQKPVFGIDDIDPSWPFIICCEGVYDALSYSNGVSLAGRSLTDYQKKLLSVRWPHHKLVMALDNDKAGKSSMLKMAKHSNSLFLNLIPVFSKFNVKDANDFAKLSDKARDLLFNRKFLEDNMMTALEMDVNLLIS